MKYCHIFIFVFFSINLVAQDWQDFYTPDSSASVIQNIKVKNDTMYAFWNRYNEESNFGITLVKIDTNGLWIDTLSYFDTSHYYTISGYYIAGLQLSMQNVAFVYGTTLDGYLYLASFDFRLRKSQMRLFSRFSNVQVNLNSNMLATDSGLYLTGTIQNTDTYGTSDAFVIHTDLEGNEIWRKTYGLAGVEELPLSIVQKSKNEIVVGAQRQSAWFNPNIPNEDRKLQNWFFCIDTSGNQVWEWLSNPNEQIGINGNIHIVDAKIIYVYRKVWWDGAFDWYAQTYLEARHLSDFSLIYRSAYGLPTHSVFNLLRTSVVSHDSLSLTVSGYENLGGNLLHVKFRLSDGAILFSRIDSVCVPDEVSVPPNFSDGIFQAELYDIATLSSGSTVSCGFVDALTTGGERIYGYILKTNSWGEDLLDDCSTVSNEEPQYTQNELFIYPNPCSERFTLEPPAYADVYRVRMYASTGALVREQVYGQVEKPEIQVSELNSGLYFVQVLSEKGQLLGVGKVVVER
jgi:hypothetical protein